MDWVNIKNIELQDMGYFVACLVNSNITNYKPGVVTEEVAEPNALRRYL